MYVLGMSIIATSLLHSIQNKIGFRINNDISMAGLTQFFAPPHPSHMKTTVLHPTCITEGPVFRFWTKLCITIMYKFPLFNDSNYLLYQEQCCIVPDKAIHLTGSWLNGLLYAEIFISAGESWVQIPPATTENSQYQLSASQEAPMVIMRYKKVQMKWAASLQTV